MKKLPARYLKVALPFVLSGLMSCLISGVATLKGFGFVPGFVKLWMSAWAVSWPVAFPAAVFALPLARRIAALFVEVPFVDPVRVKSPTPMVHAGTGPGTPRST